MFSLLSPPFTLFTQDQRILVLVCIERLLDFNALRLVTIGLVVSRFGRQELEKAGAWTSWLLHGSSLRWFPVKSWSWLTQCTGSLGHRKLLLFYKFTAARRGRLTLPVIRLPKTVLSLKRFRFVALGYQERPLYPSIARSRETRPEAVSGLTRLKRNAIDARWNFILRDVVKIFDAMKRSPRMFEREVGNDK